jgi:flavin reductase (DIM6/NTAB) family NADH-FMN oxidoreductase RutF
MCPTNSSFVKLVVMPIIDMKPIHTVRPQDVPAAAFQALMQGVIAPRPIAFASTINTAGQVNLSPFSFFNVFSSQPPILVFSPSRRVRDNTTKHSLENVLEVPEVVINIVNYPMVEQMSLASTEYAQGVNEFVKAGFTEAASVLVTPPRVAEAPAAFECAVKQVIPLGDQGGAGNLVICEVLVAHFDPQIFDEQGRISPFKADLVARMGGDWYCRAQGDALFEVPKPLQTKGIGVDALPTHIRQSAWLTGNDLGRLGNVENLPTAEEIADYRQLLTAQQQVGRSRELFHLEAQQLLAAKRVKEAWLHLLQPEAKA